jgi:eukaryotic-like serine/threonine-protein kinase
MTTRCPRCHFENSGSQKFCGECGTALPDTGGGEILQTETLATPAVKLASGSTFAGRYQVIEELGQGGMGRVYRALDQNVNEEVALKLIRPEIAADRKILERFRNELRTARRIGHRNIGRMYELMEEKGTHFISMEYVRGEDLKSAIRRFGRLPAGKALSVAGQIAEGLAEAHRLGVVHRDLKPGNIMIDREGNARILDFGIARSLEEKGITGAGVMIGTPEYMSPEQAEAREVDPRSDLYSLGVVLFEMVTGRLPFEGETALSVAMKHKNEPPPDPKIFNPQLSDDLAGLILRSMEKDKARRYQTAEDLLADLRAIEQGVPTTEKGTARRPLTSREITVTFRLKKLIAPAAALAGILIVGAVLLKVLPRKEAVPPAAGIPTSTAPIKGSAAFPAAWSNSIAVMPFTDLSPQRDQEHFCDGMTGDIIGQLSMIRDLKVIARSSVVVYRDSGKTVKEIAGELGVAHVLEGTVQREGEAIRINVQLIDAESEFQIWSAKYDRKIAGYFAIQDEISQAIADALQVRLRPESLEALKAGRTENMRLYEIYLQGMYFISSKYVLTYREEDFVKALEMFEKAKAMDPDYALTYYGLAWAFWHRYLITNDENDLKQWQFNTENASRLGSDHPEMNLPIGYIHFLNRDYDKAFEKYRMAFEAMPTDYVAYYVIGGAYLLLGLYEASIPFYEKGVELAPFFLWSRILLASSHMNLGEFEKAEGYLRETLNLNPKNPFSLAYLADYLTKVGRYDESEMLITQLESIAPDFDLLPRYKAELYAARGEKEKALELSRSPTVYSLLGMKDEAIDLMQKSISEGAFYPYLSLINNPYYDNLRNDPRFKKIVTQAKKTHDEFERKYGKFF